MPFMRRRPLLRAAAVGGVAYMGAKAGTNRAMQAQGAPAEPAPAPAAAAAPAAAPPAGDDTISRLTQLAQLHDSGALTDAEFAAAKAQVLGG
jgi:membrane protease subunit (stomatin/prohibitin family)